MNYHILEQQFTAWAETQDDVIAVVAIGSRGRIQPPPDEHSDLDLLLWTNNVDQYAAADNWLHHFGHPILSVFSHTSNHLPEWEMIYQDGHKLDVVVIQATAGPLTEMAELFPHQDVLRRGFRVLINKRGDQVEVSKWLHAAALHPNQTRFDHFVKELLLEATRALKFAQRGDLWRGKMLCDHVMKQHLLTMMEWQAVAKYGDDLDVWYDGRFLEQWADAAAVQALPGTFAAYEAKDIIRALHATVSLFHLLAEDTAARDNLVYTPEPVLAVLQWLAQAHTPHPIAALYEDLYSEEESITQEESNAHF
ncbi:MAG: aminoglycoside 6-adenylyltransferase [Chloroflexi bacterium]|nr:aminoglycoside 6-adenylyltransferase [Chloroflexota bacterium]MBP8056059.1 aminoglycoside 6-adenylyltransferase [Chloroflexota bacterium]